MKNALRLIVVTAALATAAGATTAHFAMDDLLVALQTNESTDTRFCYAPCPEGDIQAGTCANNQFCCGYCNCDTSECFKLCCNAGQVCVNGIEAYAQVPFCFNNP